MYFTFLCVILLLWTESTLESLATQQQNNRSFVDVVQREATALNGDIDPLSIQRVIQTHHLSWAVIRRQSEQFTMDKLRYIDGIDDAECAELYQLIKSVDPEIAIYDLQQCLQRMYSIFAKGFLPKCMWLKFTTITVYSGDCTLVPLFTLTAHYLYHFVILLLTLSHTANPEDFGSIELCEGIKEKFNTMRSTYLRQMQQELDQRHLGLTRDLFDVDDDEKTVEEETVQKITLKWNALGLGVGVSDFAVDCGDINDCRTMKRIVFVMDLFNEYFVHKFVGKKNHSKIIEDINYIQILTDGLRDYNGVALVDDFEHIRGHKFSADPGIKCQYAADVGGKCIGEMMREYRAKERGRSLEDNGSGDLQDEFQKLVIGLDLRERHLLETSTKIHSYLFHEVHDEKGADLEDEEKGVNGDASAVLSKWQHTGRDAEELKSKFVNEVRSEETVEKVEAKRMEDLAEALTRNGLSDVDCARLMNELKSQCYDSETIIDDLVNEEGDPFNLYPDTNLFPMLCCNLYLAKITRKHFGTRSNDDDKLPPFTFGMTYLKYWKNNKNEPGYVGSPNYDSLKEECLQNKIHPMSKEQFSRMLYKAFILLQSAKARALFAEDSYGTTTNKEIPAHSPLSVSHIFVMLMYCNDTELQYRYKKFGCRERYKGQTLDELKSWNGEIFHWSRLLTEMICFFGEYCQPNQVLYTGLNRRLCFETFAPDFKAPFSTTTSLEVANGFCDGGGVILALKATASTILHFFNVEWMSDYAHEKERVFEYSYGGFLMIADIQYYDGGK